MSFGRSSRISSHPYKRMRARKLHLETLEPRRLLATTPLITEFMASNDSTLDDGDGNSSDWIEIHNPTDAAIDLTGWHLTDDSNELDKWTFPATTLESQEYLVVFASGQATGDYVDAGGNLHTNFKLASGGEYLALADSSETIVHDYSPTFPSQLTDVSYGLAFNRADETLVAEGAIAQYIVPAGPISAWNTLSFNDAGWSTGNTGIGYETSPADYADFIETSVPSNTTSLYARHTFNVTDPTQVDELTLKVRYDDGFIAYLNGTLIEDQNAPVNPVWNSAAAGGRDDSESVLLRPFDVTDHLGDLIAGNNVLAIHALNQSGSSDMLIEAELVAISAGLQEPLVVGFQQSPSPGAANGDSFSGFVEDTSFSIDRGFFSEPITVDVSTSTPGATIVYTIDGSEPTLSNGVQVLPPDADTIPLAVVPISSTTVLRAAAFLDTFSPTNVDTQTYVFLADVITSPVLDTSITQDSTYAPLLEQAFTDVPSISLVFPDPVSGVEQQTSVEWLSPDGGEQFQIDAGVATFGGEFTNFAKKNFRLYFRSEYGAPKLEFPLFDGFDRGIPVTQTFDQLNLRSGSHDMVQRGFYMSNRFTDDTMLDAGNIAPHGRFIHLYINGVYWGQFHMRERWNDDMVSDYLGGDSDDYESINGNFNVGGWFVGEAYNGDGSGWENIKSLMGDYESIGQFLNVQNFIDYMLLYMSGNSENEYRTSGIPDGTTPYHFFLNDADGWLRTVGDRTGDAGPPAGLSGPDGIFGSLVSEGHPEFMTLLGDRIHKLFFNDGVFSPEKSTARLQERLDEIQNSFIAEAARWGYRTPSSWQNAANDALNNILPNLAQTMIGRLRTRGLYPSTAAPAFNQHGGAVPSGFQLELNTESDPPPTSDNLAFARPTTQSSNGFGFSGAEAVNGSTTDFSHTATGDLNPFFQVDLQGEAMIESIVLHNRDSCCQNRLYNIIVEVLNEAGNVVFTSPVFNPVSPGAAPTDPGETLPLDLTSEPGGGVNGYQIRVSKVAVGGSGSSEWLSLGELEVFGDFIDPPPDPGTSTIYYTLDGTDPRLPGGTISPSAIVYDATTPITVTTGSTVRTRALSGGDWSALNEADFIVAPPADAASLRITELNYNPHDANQNGVTTELEVDNDEFEFVELRNIGTETIELSGVQFVEVPDGADNEGIEFTFDQRTLAAGEFILVVKNQLAFESRYGEDLNIAGEYSGRLSNGGEQITLRDASGADIQSFEYDDMDDWPGQADGLGSSLEVIDVAGDYDMASNWRASATLGGTPGSGLTSGDFDGDNDVDGADFLAWQRGFGTSGGATLEDGDANADGNVDGLDLGVWQTQLGDISPLTAAIAIVNTTQSLSAAEDAVAEPTDLSLLATVAALYANTIDDGDQKTTTDDYDSAYTSYETDGGSGTFELYKPAGNAPQSPTDEVFAALETKRGAEDETPWELVDELLPGNSF